MPPPLPSAPRKPYPSDVSDEECAFIAPYLALVREDAPQHQNSSTLPAAVILAPCRSFGSPHSCSHHRL